MQCVSCSDPLPEAARFCPSCGTPCAPTATAGEERKVVSVIFCDLVGSTSLSGRLDPESLRWVTLRYFDLMRSQIEAHGGTVEKFIGDAVMAVFGVPTTHEDDARRAAAAALDMVEALRGLNTEVESLFECRLDVRIGVNTGQVVAGSDASARQALVSGETVNVAARLEQNAAPGQILIGPTTLQALGSSAITEPVGPLHLKGKTDAVQGHVLLALREDDPELLRRFDVPFVGRAAELRTLDRELDRVRARGGTRLVTVAGEAGMGKTRLVREWLERTGPAALHGAGRCRPYGEQGSLAPLAEAVGQLLTASGTGSTTADPGEGAQPDAPLSRAMAMLSAGLLRDGTPGPSLDETCSALRQLLAHLAAERPLVLLIDDCHWAGPLLLDVLERLVSALPQQAVLFICATRPELWDLRPRGAVSSPRHTPLLLGGLSAQEAQDMAEALTEVRSHTVEVPERALERAEGNPLHLEQLLTAAGETDSSGELPPTLQALLGARIGALQQTERTALDLAAVLGREFSLRELAELAADGSDVDEHAVRPVLGRLAQRRLIGTAHATASPVFRFSSSLVQDVAYGSMAKRTRAERHERAAELPTVRARGDAASGGHLELAHRYRTELGLLDQRTDVLRHRSAALLARAGAAALARSDLPWAEDLLARSVQLSKAGDRHLPGAARSLGEARIALGRVEEGRASLRSVLQGPAAPVDSAHARLALAVADGHADPRSVSRTARAVLPVFEAAGDELGQARACIRMAQQEQARGQHRAAEQLLTRALRHAVLADAEPERAVALGAVGISLWRGPQPVSAAADHCQALLSEHGALRPTVRITLNCPLAVLQALRGDWQQAQASLLQAEHLANDLGYAEAAVALPLFHAQVDALSGHTGRALEALDRAAHGAAALGAGALKATIARERARLLTDTGRWQEAEAALLQTPGTATDESADAVDSDGVRARLAAEHGDADIALLLSERIVYDAARTDSPIVQALAWHDRAHVLLRLGRPEDATAAADHAAGHYRTKGHLPGLAQVQRLTATRTGTRIRSGTGTAAPENQRPQANEDPSA